jgi:MFS family permease
VNTPAGQLIDRIGSRRPMIAGLFCQAVAPFGYVAGLGLPTTVLLTVPGVGPISPSSGAFLIARSVWGVGSALVFLGAFATITHVTRQGNRGRWMGFYRGLQSLGFPTGLILGGFLLDVVGPETGFLLAGVLGLVGAIIAVVVVPDVQAETDTRARLREIPGMLRREPRLLPLSLGVFLVRVLWSGVILATAAKYAVQLAAVALGVGAASPVNYLLSAGRLVYSGTTVVSGRLSDSLDNRVLMTVPGLLALAAGFGVLALLPTLFGLVLGNLLIGLGNGGTRPVLLAALGDFSRGDEVGRSGGVYRVFGDVGSSVGPLLAVPAVDVWLGYQDTYLLCVGLALSCVVLFAVTLFDVRDLVDLRPSF